MTTGDRMPKDEAFEVEGTVVQALANTRFKVELETGNEVLAHELNNEFHGSSLT